MINVNGNKNKSKKCLVFIIRDKLNNFSDRILKLWNKQEEFYFRNKKLSKSFFYNIAPKMNIFVAFFFYFVSKIISFLRDFFFVINFCLLIIKFKLKNKKKREKKII